MTTTTIKITLEIDLARPVDELEAKVMGRAYTIDGVEDVRRLLDTSIEELEQENRLLRARNERLEGEAKQQPAEEPVATDWERIARVQDAKLRAMCGEAGGFEKLCEVMDRYEARPQPAAQWVGLEPEQWFAWWQVSTVMDKTEAEIDFADFLMIALAVQDVIGVELREKNGSNHAA